MCVSTNIYGACIFPLLLSYLRSICPKHWQLPRVKANRVVTNPETGAWDWKPILDDKTFYKWLNSYGWTSYANNIFYGATKWQDGELTYLINLEPFYVPSSGSLIAGQYVAHSGFAWSYWSKSTDLSTLFPTILLESL